MPVAHEGLGMVSELKVQHLNLIKKGMHKLPFVNNIPFDHVHHPFDQAAKPL